MELCLVQHGLAKSAEEDPDRALTAQGIEQTELLAPVIEKISGLGVVWHSGKKRAQQTAEIILNNLDRKPELRRVDGLAPNDDPHIIYKKVETSRENILIVGHLPHLARLAALVLGGDADRQVVEIQNSGILCLSNDPGPWRVRWYVVPWLLEG